MTDTDRPPSDPAAPLREAAQAVVDALDECRFPVPRSVRDAIAALRAYRQGYEAGRTAAHPDDDRLRKALAIIAEETGDAPDAIGVTARNIARTALRAATEEAT